MIQLGTKFARDRIKLHGGLNKAAWAGRMKLHGVAGL